MCPCDILLSLDVCVDDSVDDVFCFVRACVRGYVDFFLLFTTQCIYNSCACANLTISFLPPLSLWHTDATISWYTAICRNNRVGKE